MAAPQRPCRLPAALLALSSLTLAPASGQGGGFRESTQVTAVEIPVQVVRDGEPVRGLAAGDFEVYEGDRRQPVTGFDVVDLTAAAAAAGAAPSAAASPPVPAAARRHFLLLFDLAYAEPKSILKAQQAAGDVMVKNLTPSDLVAVARYSPADGTHLILNFTADRRQIGEALQRIGVPTLSDRTADPLRLIFDFYANPNNVPGASEAASSNPAAATRAALRSLALEYLEKLQRASERASREQQTARAGAMTRALDDLARLMAGVSGRKQVVYFSEGFDSAILQGVESKQERDEMASQAMTGDNYKVDSDRLFGNTRETNRTARMLESFRRADCVIQAVDIGGLRGASEPAGVKPSDQTMGYTRPSGEAVLFQMAHDTGGELYRNFNDLGAAMQQLMHKTSVTYLLTIQPEGIRTDGAYHPLRVELRNAPRGTRVTFRPGYYAPRPYGKQSGVERALTAANELMSGGTSGAGAIAATVLAAPFRAGEKAYVPVLIDVDGASLLAGAPAAGAAAGTPEPAAGVPAVAARLPAVSGDVAASAAVPAGQLPAEIYVYAMDRSGVVGDYLVQTLALDLAKVGPQLRQGGLKFFGHLELAPGDYTLRVLVRNGTTGAVGARVSPLAVPDFGGGKPVLLAPFLHEPPGRWLLVRELPRGQLGDAPYPFMAGDQPFVPASRPALVPGQEAALSLVGWNWGAGDIDARARILSPEGRDAGAARLELKGREAESEGSPERIEVTFRPPAALPPGEYQLAVTVTGAGGSRTAAVPFSILARPPGSA
jgi:VWFA-related protein